MGLCSCVRVLTRCCVCACVRRQDGDGIIIGASSMSQLDANVASLEKTSALPDKVVAAMDAAWEACKRDCPSYERGHSKLAP